MKISIIEESNSYWAEILPTQHKTTNKQSISKRKAKKKSIQIASNNQNYTYLIIGKFPYKLLAISLIITSKS